MLDIEKEEKKGKEENEIKEEEYLNEIERLNKEDYSPEITEESDKKSENSIEMDNYNEKEIIDIKKSSNIKIKNKKK